MRAYQVAYRDKNRERLLQQERDHHQSRKSDRNSARRSRYATHSDSERAAAKERYWRNPDSRIASAIDWAQSNPERRQAHRSTRKAAKRAAGVYLFTGQDWLRLCRRFNDLCAYCGQKKPLTQDHVVPIARGGHHALGNILPACMSCNSSKGARLLVEWRARRPKE